MARLGLTVGITLIMAALTAAACGSSKGSSAVSATTGGPGAGPANPQPGPGTSTPPAAAATPASTVSGEPATVSTVANPTEGTILVGPDGRTLYLFDEDHGTTTACTGSCETFWPALAAPKPTAGTGVDASALSVVNAQVPDQVVYKGHLLYYFSKDTAPGDVNGASIPHWFPLGPDGSKVTKD